MSHFDRSEHDLSILNLERFLYGGVRFQDPLFAAFDLELLLTWSSAETVDDPGPFHAVVDAWEALPASAAASEAHKALQGVIKGNSNQRRAVVEIAALAGLLVTPLPLMTEAYVPLGERDEAHPGGRNDWGYPAHHWRGEHGVNRAAVLDMLG